MKSLLNYILEEKSERTDIKFTIWKAPDNRVDWIDDDENYQKIEYLYNNKNEGITIDFLLGKKNDTWHLWAGKNGSVNYYDEPYYDTKETKFALGIMSAIDKIQELIEDVKKNKENWVQYYINK